ncbi:hypothetical protein EDD11_008831 [Mortierella claussenii]|nr:hypothetical protein EDD11_008831 [Mortierella claussenii]
MSACKGIDLDASKSVSLINKNGVSYSKKNAGANKCLVTRATNNGGSSQSSASSLPLTAIIAGSVGGVVFLIVVCALLIIFLRRRQRRRKRQISGIEAGGGGGGGAGGEGAAGRGEDRKERTFIPQVNNHHDNEPDVYGEKPPMDISRPNGLGGRSDGAAGLMRVAAAGAGGQVLDTNSERHWTPVLSKRMPSDTKIVPISASKARRDRERERRERERARERERETRDSSRARGRGRNLDRDTDENGSLAIDMVERPMLNHNMSSTTSIGGSTMVSFHQNLHSEEQKQQQYARGTSPTFSSHAPSLSSTRSTTPSSIPPRTASRISNNSVMPAPMTIPTISPHPKEYVPKSHYASSTPSSASIPLQHQQQQPQQKASAALQPTQRQQQQQQPLPPSRRNIRSRRKPVAEPVSAPVTAPALALDPVPVSESARAPVSVPMERPESEYLGGYIDLIPIEDTPKISHATLPSAVALGKQRKTDDEEAELEYAWIQQQHYQQQGGYHDDRERS